MKLGLTKNLDLLITNHKKIKYILHGAVMNNNSNIVKKLLDKKANVNALDEDLWTPLHYAAALNDNGETYGILEEYGADPNKEDEVR